MSKIAHLQLLGGHILARGCATERISSVDKRVIQGCVHLRGLVAYRAITSGRYSSRHKIGHSWFQLQSMDVMVWSGYYEELAVEDILSQPLPNVQSSEMWMKSYLTLLWTSTRGWRQQAKALTRTRLTSSQMVNECSLNTFWLDWPGNLYVLLRFSYPCKTFV